MTTRWGKWREEDNGPPVDASGEVFGTDVAGEFNGAVELAQSEQTMDCMARTWLAICPRSFRFGG